MTNEALKQSESTSVVDELKAKLEAKTKECERLAVQLDKLETRGVKLWGVLQESNQKVERLRRLLAVGALDRRGWLRGPMASRC